MSPDIPVSHKFKWAWDQEQSTATIRIYASDKTTFLKEYTVGSENEVDANDLNYNFVAGTTYYWTIQTQNSGLSDKAKFKYDRAERKPMITWSTDYPESGQIITKGSKFSELKSNLSILLDSYSGVSYRIREKANDLFSGKIVPSKKDFNDLQDIIEFIGTKEGIEYKTTRTRNGARKHEVMLNPTPARKYNVEDTVFTPFSTIPNPEIKPSNLNVIEWVSDSLGASDINKVIAYINYLTQISPKPINKLSFNLSSSSMYQITSLSVSSDGEEDKTIDNAWDISDMPNNISRISFDELSSSPDIWFYDCQFSYGPNGMYKSRIFLRPEDIIDTSGIAERLFNNNWDELFSDRDLSSALLKFEMAVVDNYANISPVKEVSKTFSSNFKVPIGVERYILETQKTDLGSTAYSTGGTWYEKYNGSNKSKTYTITGNEGRLWHRVMAVDKSGLKTDWFYDSSPITFDPLDPPSKPTNFRQTGKGVDYVELKWNESARAESYELWSEEGYGAKYQDDSTTYQKVNNLNDDTKYDFFVRAVNRKGKSGWVKGYATTDADVKETTWNSLHAHSWRDNWGWRSSQGVNHTYVYQGEWNGYGNHKGLWYFNYNDIKNVTSGKEIVSVWVQCKRIRGGYISSGVARFWLHNRSTNSWENNHSSSPGKLYDPGARKDEYDKNGHYANDYWFSIGEKQWVKLPNEYAEWIRDGKARGIAIHEEDGYRYLKFDNNAKIKIKYK
jgi:hypothetical protein